MRDHLCARRCCPCPSRSHNEQINEIVAIPAVRIMTAGAEIRTARSFHKVVFYYRRSPSCKLTDQGVIMQKSVTLLFAGAIAFAGSSLYAQKGDAAKGKEVFEQCSVCHNSDSTEVKMGPGLKGLFKRGKMASGKPVNDANVMNQIEQGGNGMPAYKDLLSAEEKANVLAYLKTL